MPNGRWAARTLLLFCIGWCREGGAVAIRILVALEDDYRVYRETIAAGIRILRPRAETKSVELKALEDEVERFEPQVVIYSGPTTVDTGGSPTWVKLSLDPTSSTKISVRGYCLERTNPTLEELLELIDQVEEANITGSIDLPA